MASYQDWDADITGAIIREYATQPGPMLPILHALQAYFGYIYREAVPLIADILNLSRAEVHGVVTFYHDFRHTAPGRHVLKLCRAEACQSMGGDQLAARAEKKLGVALGKTTRNGRVSLEAVYCLSLCATAPSAMPDGRVVGRLNVEMLDHLLEQVEQ